MAEFTPITTQEQLDKVIGERIAGVKAKYEGFDDYKKKAEDYDALKTKSDGFEQQIAALNEEINGDGKKNIGYKKQLEEAQGTEEEQLDILTAFNDGFAKKVAKGLDLAAMHGINPRTGTASAVIGDNHFDAKVTQTVDYASASLLRWRSVFHWFFGSHSRPIH